MNVIPHFNVAKSDIWLADLDMDHRIGTFVSRVTAAPARLFHSVTDPFRRVVDSFDASIDLQNDEF